MARPHSHLTPENFGTVTFNSKVTESRFGTTIIEYRGATNPMVLLLLFSQVFPPTTDLLLILFFFFFCYAVIKKPELGHKTDDVKRS
jgi:hypothetical protein